MSSRSPICAFLREGHVPCTVAAMPTEWTPSAQAETAGTQVRGRECAKVVVCLVDGEPIEAILPVSLTVNLTRLLALTGGSDVRLPTDDEMDRLFPTGERNPRPAFSPLYGLAVCVDVVLVGAAEIVFQAGQGREMICVRWADFARCVRPIVGPFAEPPLLWARYRVSPSE
ncbi:MAG: YbaK/EbsC family protein [Acidobacteriota bacterium]